MKEVLKYVNLNKVKTFNLQQCDTYELKEDSYTKLIIIYCIKLFEELEKNNDIIIALRGLTKDEYFKNDQLRKFFVVGEKSGYYLKENKEQLYCGDFDKKDQLVRNVNELVNNINKVIKERENKHPIRGEIPYVCNELDIEELRVKKLVYLSVLHNIGGRWDDKKSSPFMSVTYGGNKLNTALKFCKCNKERDIGFVFIYFIPKKSKYFIKTKDLNEYMKKIGVTWYQDINSEIMMIDGILPHYLFGILEIVNNDTHELIINPWLYNQLKNGYKFSPIDGILINQIHFNEYAKNLGYKKYYCEVDDKRQQSRIDDIMLF